MKKPLALLIAAAFLFGCSPKNEYEAFIFDQGYIPFKQPLADIGVGALLDGSPDQLRVLAPPKRCFPDDFNGVPTEVRQVTAADLPEIAKHVSVEVGVDVDVIAANGTPLFKLNSELHSVKSLDVKIEGASIEFLDEIVFADWMQSGMSESCKKYLVKGGSFVRQALRVDKMSFQFKDSKSGSIAISTDNIDEIIDIDAHVSWEITDNFTLTITTPKYIGYHLAKVSKDDPTSIAWIASDLTQDGKFNYRPVTAYRSYLRGLMRLE